MTRVTHPLIDWLSEADLRESKILSWVPLRLEQPSSLLHAAEIGVSLSNDKRNAEPAADLEIITIPSRLFLH